MGKASREKVQRTAGFGKRHLDLTVALNHQIVALRFLIIAMLIEGSGLPTLEILERMDRLCARDLTPDSASAVTEQILALKQLIRKPG